MKVRRLWPDRNPLRRAADRAEFAVAALLLVAFLAGVPLTALAAAQWATASEFRTERAQAGWHQVPAVLVHDASTRAGSTSFRLPWTRVPASTGRSGRATAVSVTVTTLASRVSLAAVAVPVTLSVMLLDLWACAGIFLDWRRMHAWDADWAKTEPKWSGQR